MVSPHIQHNSTLRVETEKRKYCLFGSKQFIYGGLNVEVTSPTSVALPSRSVTRPLFVAYNVSYLIIRLLI